MCVLAWLVRGISILYLFVVYLTVSSEGLRSLFEMAATPLYKTGLWPLTAFGGYVETRKLDLAHVLSLGMLVVVWVSWEMIVRLYANEAPMTNARRIVWASGTVVLFCDAVLFWNGMSQSSFLGGASLFGASVITAMYVGMLVLLAFFVNLIEGKIQ